MPMKERTAEKRRKTKETEIYVKIDLDGTGVSDISTGIGFFDHMLEGFAKHGLFDLTVRVNGDLYVDSHHTIEDTGIVLGQAFLEALGEKKGIRRFGYFLLPMDETLAMCAADLSGRPFLKYQACFTVDKIGDMDTEMIREFFYAFSYSAMMNLHLKIVDEGNNHHMAEALFKSFGKTLMMAVSSEPRMTDVWSTKGSL
ncbi:imidazoleglycerol-phosphate dehydratase [Drancourtella sp. An210]|uniref:Imidazoleglycerol-phosphate dehydratase n=2 Tax=Lachnospiraceae TaxID=186803 RepID=A0ABS7L7G3_9FIRM|nr:MULTISPECIES: imidazoleglycerol-phosphate dehydratase HisB [Sellimonas]MBY0759041.1 imidazoleglycerol-phosphate dehydratase HisB [Sellimonas caecigallum]OUP00601.1 imidazoleglycerol-phosphate dehydratase [Drancourtella sp. An210]OUP65837.1 imidazoleglycerol-phosphate dehydratase [Drancourtella sp. An177]